MKRIHIATLGTHTAMSGAKVNIDTSFCEDVISTYDPKLHEAPLVIGHPKSNGPAYGWVQAISFSKDGLHVDPQQVNPEFGEMVEGGAFKKISPSFYAPDAPGNPTPGKWHLRHIGFLGAMPPAIKGLQAVQFSEEEDGILTIEFGEQDPSTLSRILRSIRDFFIDKHGQEEADKAISPWDLEHLERLAAQPDTTDPAFSENPEPETEETPAVPADDPRNGQSAPDAAAKTAELDKREADITARENAMKTKEDDMAKAAEAEADKKAETEAEEFAESLVKKGKLTPAQKPGAVTLVKDLIKRDGSIDFGEGEGDKPALDVLKDLLGATPKAVNFNEHSAPGDDDADGTIDFSDPVSISDAATAYQTAQKAKGKDITHAQAVRAIAKDNKA